MDGVFADASFDGKTGYIGIVLLKGVTVEEEYLTAYPNCPSSHAAELAAVELAKQLFPGATIYSDCLNTSNWLGVEWVPREQNWNAHCAARRARKIQLTPFEPTKAPKRKPKRWGARGKRGAGVCAPGTQRF